MTATQIKALRETARPSASRFKCRFCERRGLVNKCAAVFEQYKPVYVSAIQPGDRICRIIERYPKQGSHAIVQKAGPKQCAVYGVAFEITIRIYRRNRPARDKTFERSPYARYRKAVMAPCEEQICDLCGMERAANYHVCPDHWWLWKEIS